MSQHKQKKWNPYKFGAGEYETGPYQYGNLFEIRKTTGPAQLVIAPAMNHIDLMIELARALPEPFCILYVLKVSRTGAVAGRYQSPVPLDRPVAESFLLEYKDFFENDGRHHVWLLARPDFHGIIYDNHNVLYAYGQIEKFCDILLAKGLSEGKVKFPVPHRHCYNPEYDDMEEQVFAHWEWTKFPLQEGDDP